MCYTSEVGGEAARTCKLCHEKAFWILDDFPPPAGEFPIWFYCISPSRSKELIRHRAKWNCSRQGTFSYAKLVSGYWAITHLARLSAVQMLSIVFSAINAIYAKFTDQTQSWRLRPRFRVLSDDAGPRCFPPNNSVLSFTFLFSAVHCGRSESDVVAYHKDFLSSSQELFSRPSIREKTVLWTSSGPIWVFTTSLGMQDMPAKRCLLKTFALKFRKFFFSYFSTSFPVIGTYSRLLMMLLLGGYPGNLILGFHRFTDLFLWL